MQQQGENADVAGRVQDGVERLEIFAEQVKQTVLQGLGSRGRSCGCGSVAGAEGCWERDGRSGVEGHGFSVFDDDGESRLAGDQGVAVSENRIRHPLSVEPGTVAAVEVDDAASV